MALAAPEMVTLLMAAALIGLRHMLRIVAWAVRRSGLIYWLGLGAVGVALVTGLGLMAQGQRAAGGFLILLSPLLAGFSTVEAMER